MNCSLAEIRLGCSGWSYAEWEGVFYPSAEESKLRFYSKLFRTAEIDSTFYAYPRKGVVYGWLRGTSDDFVFAAKLPGLITHEKLLDLEEGVETDLVRFLDLMKPLHNANRLGPLLIQLPPRFKKNYEVLTNFFKILPGDFKFACEFRHPSWWSDETWELLRKYRVAATIVDEPLLPPDPIVTADFAFVRWHGKGKRPWYYYRYEVEELEPWVPKLNEVSMKVKEIYGYFNNHFHGYAVLNCTQMLELIQKATPEQTKVKEDTIRYLEGKAQPSILSFDLDTAGLDDLLLLFADRIRIDRARRIDDSELGEVKVNSRGIQASIREYTALVDLDDRKVLHDCADWDEQIGKKEFCKHLCKVMLSIPEEKATRILRRIATEKKSWEFARS